MDKILFIVNPTAGGGKAKGLVSTIGQVMDEKRVEYDIVLTEKPEDAISIAKEGIAKGYEKLVAVGGDGTVNEVARGILESGNGKLGILPSGTGNDMARSLNLEFDPIKAIDTIIEGNKKHIDVGFVNNKLFLNIASIGFDAETVKNTESIKDKIMSNIAYVIGVFVTLFKFRNKRVKIEIDDQFMDKDICLIAIGSGKYYGGGLKILPMAVLDDGYFHICVVNKISKLKLFFLFPTILKGSHVKFKKHVEIFKAKKIKVITKDKTYLNVDGEIHHVEEETLFAIGDGKVPIFVNL